MRHRTLPQPGSPRTHVLAVATSAVVLAAAVAVVAWPAASAVTGDPAAPVAAAATPLPTMTVLAVPASPTASPTVTATTPVKAKKLTLAELRTEVARLDDDLERRTAALDAGRAALATSQKQLVTVRADATAARATADQAHVDLGRYAAAAYRGQQLSPVVSVVMGSPGNATDALRSVEDLRQTGEVKTDIATYAAQTAAQAQALEAQAAALAASNTATAARLQAERDAVSAQATAVQKQLDAEILRVAIEKVKKEAKGCLDKVEAAEAFPNGMIPPEALCSIGIDKFMMRGDAAVSFKKLAVAYEKEFDAPICVTSAYRTRALQTKLFAADPVMVAAPGKSHHGLGIAADLCGGIQSFSSKQHTWMNEHAAEFDWYHPAWAEPNGVTPEPWHWEFRVPD